MFHLFYRSVSLLLVASLLAPSARQSWAQTPSVDVEGACTVRDPDGRAADWQIELPASWQASRTSGLAFTARASEAGGHALTFGPGNFRADGTARLQTAQCGEEFRASRFVGCVNLILDPGRGTAALEFYHASESWGRSRFMERRAERCFAATATPGGEPTSSSPNSRPTPRIVPTIEEEIACRAGAMPAVPILLGILSLGALAGSVSFGVIYLNNYPNPPSHIVDMDVVSILLGVLSQTAGAIAIGVETNDMSRFHSCIEGVSSAHPTTGSNAIERLSRSDLLALGVSPARVSATVRHLREDSEVIRNIAPELTGRVETLARLSPAHQRAQATELVEWIQSELEGRVNDTTLDVLRRIGGRHLRTAGARIPRRDGGVDLTAGPNPVFTTGSSLGVRF